MKIKYAPIALYGRDYAGMPVKNNYLSPKVRRAGVTQKEEWADNLYDF